MQLTNGQQTYRENPSYPEMKERNVYKDMGTATYIYTKVLSKTDLTK